MRRCVDAVITVFVLDNLNNRFKRSATKDCPCLASCSELKNNKIIRVFEPLESDELARLDRTSKSVTFANQWGQRHSLPNTQADFDSLRRTLFISSDEPLISQSIALQINGTKLWFLQTAATRSLRNGLGYLIKERLRYSAFTPFNTET